MGLESLVSSIDYTASGTTPTYAYTFMIQLQTDLLVTVASPAGVEYTLVLTTDYTVTGVGEAAGGTITLVDVNQAWLDSGGDLTVGWTIRLRRVCPLTQITDLRNQGPYFGADVEDAIDKSRMIDQQHQDEIDRSLKLPESVDPADFDVELPANIVGESNMILGTNDDGDGITLLEVSDVVAMGAAQTYVVVDGQAATSLPNETHAAASYTSIVYNYEIIRGTTVFSTGTFSLHYRNSVWYVAEGEERKEDAAPIHGVTWSVTGTTTAQLKAALDVGAGNGTIKLKRHRFSV